jgi:hypothetical protein
MGGFHPSGIDQHEENLKHRDRLNVRLALLVVAMQVLIWVLDVRFGAALRLMFGI